MRVLIACEFSGVVREAFLARGHDAYSCDILPSNHLRANPPERHIQKDVTPLLLQEWDLVIAHPPCTYLANSGVRWFKNNPYRKIQMIEGCDFFLKCLNANSPRVCVENPIMHKYAMERIKVKPTQRIQPWQFGHGDTKCTCLWLKGLPLLQPTKIVDERNAYSHMVQTRDCRQGLIRSITYTGIAEAMADQWGGE